MEKSEGGGRVSAGGERGGSTNQRWSLWKTLAVAGVAVASAPVVAPPLILLSAIGLAFAVPCGLLLAGYASTDKLMRSLLSPPVENKGGDFAGDEGENEGITEAFMEPTSVEIMLAAKEEKAKEAKSGETKDVGSQGGEAKAETEAETEAKKAEEEGKEGEGEDDSKAKKKEIKSKKTASATKKAAG